MIIRIQKRDNPFVQIDKRPLEDERLSWKAKGLLAHLLCKPDTWEISVADLVSRSKDGREAVQSALRELKQLGYATLESKRGEGGRLLGKTWVIYELPTDGKPGFRSTTDERENRLTGKPSNGKSATSNNILEERIDEEREEPRAPELPKKEEKSVMAQQVELLVKANPGVSPAELKVFVLKEAIKDHFKKYPINLKLYTTGLTPVPNVTEFMEQIDIYVRYYSSESVPGYQFFINDPVAHIPKTFPKWLRRWASGKRDELRRSGATAGVYEKPKI